MTAAIELQGVNKSFGPKLAVRDLDLRVNQGELIGLIGPNGAGKTTSIRMVMSIIFPDSGRISVLGRASAVESKDRIGYLPEERGLYKKMKVGFILKYFARLKGVAESGLDAKVDAWLDRMSLRDVARKKCEELSKGMQQKVQFIASVIHEPDLLILDEPFSGLDPVNSRLFRTLIDEQRAAGRTIVFSTHQMSQAEALCDRVVMIHEGRKVLDNTPEEVRSRFDPRAVAFESSGPFDAATLRAMPEVSNVDATGSGGVLHLKDGVEAASMIARVAGAVRVRRVEVVRPTLEDVFIEIVSRTSGATKEELADSLRASAEHQEQAVLRRLADARANARADTGGD